MSLTIVTSPVTAAVVAGKARHLVAAEAAIPVLFTDFAISVATCTDSLAKQSAAIKKAEAAKYASTATLNRVQVTGSYLVRDASPEAVAQSGDLYSAVIAAVTAKPNPVGIPAIREALAAVDVADGIGAAIAAVEALTQPAADEVPTDEVATDEAPVTEEAPADKSLTYLQQALSALVNYDEKGTPSREHEGTLDMIAAQLAEALAKVQALPMPGGVIISSAKRGKKAAA